MKWCGDFVNAFANNSRRVNRTSATVVQFSGFKKLEESYIPDNDGNAFDDDDSLKHYKVEYGPKLVSFSNNFDLGPFWAKWRRRYFKSYAKDCRRVRSPTVFEKGYTFWQIF